MFSNITKISEIALMSSIIFPILVGILLFAVRGRLSRYIIVGVSSVLLIGLSVVTLFATPFKLNFEGFGVLKLSTIITICDFALLALILGISIKYKKVLSSILVILQIIPLIYFEFIANKNEQTGYTFINDYLSVVLMLLILIIGPLISAFALRYMNDFEHHLKVQKSRQPFFFFIVFLFLGSMSGLVLSNNLLNMYFFWEMTTLCSFLLISFSKTEETINNAFRALWMNLVGGIAFIVAIILFSNITGTIYIDQILTYKGTAAISLPLALLAIAAFTKAAQFPFQSWLLGAMVAPTPVSALLHSSTMVKAGVYLLVRFSPLLMNTRLGYAIAILGGFTFFAAAGLAIAQHNAKKVLAYSTISNLGLIVATAGIGTPIAVTAAILLIIFHAVSKALLFLCVGTIEHGIGSRDIEDMDGLISKMPLVGSLTAIGMFSMLLPPFGVIITKLLGIEAAANVPIVLLFIVMGSAFTVMFWTKWMGKVLTISQVKQERVENYSMATVIPLSILAIGIVVVSLSILQINSYLIVPYINQNGFMPPNINLGSLLLIPVFIAILCLIILIPIFILKIKPESYRSPYLCGENVDGGSMFRGPADTKTEMTFRNYYLELFFKEEDMTIIANIFALAFIFFMFGVII